MPDVVRKSLNMKCILMLATAAITTMKFKMPYSDTPGRFEPPGDQIL